MQYIEQWRYSHDEIKNLEKKIKETPYYWTKQWIKNHEPKLLKSYNDSLSIGQFESKMWLINELKKFDWSILSHIEIIGGWYGYPLIELLETIINIKQIDFYEIDESCKKILAQHITNFKPDYKIALFGDYFQRKEIRRRQLIINTSSEHMSDIAQMKQYYKDYPEPPYVVIQSNNYFSLEEHVNCVESVEELIEKSKLKKVLFAGEKELDLYTRYMVIGQW